MEYEIYYLCNLIGIVLVVGIIIFHFVEADKKPKKKISSEQAAKETKQNLIK
jgi:hypothetical protein